MKILLIGSTGFVGSALLKEALHKGHEVTAVVRREGALQETAGLSVVPATITSSEQVADLARGHDVVIASVSARKPGDTPIPEVIQTVAAGAQQAGVKLFVVGGAGSLEVAPGVKLMDIPQFPAEYKHEAQQQGEALELLKSTDHNWTYLSPAAIIAPGERTTQYRLGTDQLLSDAAGNSNISVEDYAHAVISELEDPKHERQRFTIAY
ncbi:NAD(P)-dependent oxidoreductase [Deinococcus roseus]|uniref:NAD-dependent dehydratase n=1 Tax=Deinococcus roseus TaxID=392414 RepID=A0ABQ2CYK5_9DEIO|nr:NAD(P)-dependent oxidoreductase [Deinococcus roseus]GGJ32019.1 NAD-dependent dehydratase [Deinococcus roseus]